MSSVMSLQGYIDRDYQATRMSADEQKRWEREHSCHRRGCDAAAEETLQCDFCGVHFCPDHRKDYGGTCACFECDNREPNAHVEPVMRGIVNGLLRIAGKLEQARRVA